MMVTEALEVVIGPDTQVTLHFALKLSDGAVIDSTFEKSPATFTVGDGKLLPGFEQAIYGLRAGAKDTFVITPDKGFGQPNPNNIQVFSRDQFKDVDLVEGLMLSFADAQKTETPGVVKTFDDSEVRIDFNHPLAGRNVHFQVEIINVKTVDQPGLGEPTLDVQSTQRADV